MMEGDEYSVACEKAGYRHSAKSLTKEEMDKGDNYISVMKENLQALLKTTTVAGKEIKPEH